MKKAIFLAVFVFLTAAFARAQASGAEGIYEKYNAAVVRIYSYHQDKTLHGQGSGVILKDLGLVITNHHVLGDGVELNAQNSGKFLKMDSVVASNPQMDILILHYSEKDDDNKKMKIPSLKICEKKNIKIGQRIYAIGSPYDLENTITEGLISGIRRETDSSREFIQLSAPISQGSSGGAILNAKGELVGITSMVISGQTAQNLNFAIPIYEIMKLLNKNGAGNMTGADLANYYFNMANNDFMNSRYSAAITHYKKALSLQKENEWAAINYQLGLCYNRLNNLDSAIWFFQRSITKTTGMDGFVGLGHAYFELGYFSLALQSFSKALEYDSLMTDALMGAASSAYSLKLYNESFVFVQRILRHNEYHSGAWYLAGNLTFVANKPNEALKFYQMAARISPGLALAWLGMAEVYKITSETEKEMECRQKAYSLDPSLREP